MLSQNAVGLPDNDGCRESVYALTAQRRSLLDATLEIAIKTKIKVGLGYCGSHLQPSGDGLIENCIALNWQAVKKILNCGEGN